MSHNSSKHSDTSVVSNLPDLKVATSRLVSETLKAFPINAGALHGATGV